MTTLHGLHVPLITPFDPYGNPDLTALDQLAHTVLAAGARGLVALGTTAEPATLTTTERRDIRAVTSAACRHHHATLTVGANDPETLHDLADADAALTLVPPFTRPGENAVIAHLTTLAATSPVPLVVYHVPDRTGQPLSSDALHRIAAIPNVTGMKLATGTIDTTTIDFTAHLPTGFTLLAGDDPLLTPLLALGAHGAIAASAHLATAAFADLIHAWHTGDTTHARTLGHRLAALSLALFAEPNPTAVKAVLHHQGKIPTPAVRPPLLPATAPTLAGALNALDALPDPN